MAPTNAQSAIDQAHANDVSIAVLTEKVGQLATAFEAHRAQSKLDHEATQTKLTKMQTSLDMAKGGYVVILGCGAILAYVTGVFKLVFDFFHHTV